MTKRQELLLDGLKLTGIRSDNGGICVLRSN